MNMTVILILFVIGLLMSLMGTISTMRADIERLNKKIK